MAEDITRAGTKIGPIREVIIILEEEVVIKEETKVYRHPQNLIQQSIRPSYVVTGNNRVAASRMTDAYSLTEIMS